MKFNQNKYLQQTIKILGIVLIVISFNLYNEQEGFLFLIPMFLGCVLYVAIPSFEKNEVKE